MEFILEFIGECIFEFVIEMITNRNISKWIRYPICFIISFFYLFILLGLFTLGIMVLKDSVAMAIIVWAINGLMLYSLYKIIQRVRR